MSIGNSPEDDQPSAVESAEDERPAPEDDRPSIGHVLQQARIAAGLTVDEVSASTRVRIPIVHAIEEDDFSPLWRRRLRPRPHPHDRARRRHRPRTAGRAVRRRARRAPVADARRAAVRGRTDPPGAAPAQLDGGHGRRDRRGDRLRRFHHVQRWRRGRPGQAGRRGPGAREDDVRAERHASPPTRSPTRRTAPSPRPRATR